MTSEQFKVDFIGNDRLTPIIQQIATEFAQLYVQVNSSIIPTIRQINQEFSNTTGIKSYASAVAKMAGSMQKLSQIPQPVMPSVGNLATEVQAVNAELQNALNTLRQIRQMRTVNINVNQNQRGGGGGGAGGGGGGGGGGAGGRFGGGAFSAFEHGLHVFNSLTFAIGTAQIAFQNFFNLIERGNEVTRANATMLALISAQGYNASRTTELYNTSLSTAIRNQMAFGGTLAENTDNLLKVQQMSHAYGVSVREINDALQLLTLRDPVQGIQGATIALQELMSGDPMSLRRRFELPADDVNRLARQAGNASIQVAGLNELLRSQGIEASVLQARLENVTRTYRHFEVASSNAADTVGQFFSQLAQPAFAQMAEHLAYASLGLQAFQAYNRAGMDGTLQQLDLTGQLTKEQQILYEEYVRSGVIQSETVKARIDAEEQAYRTSAAIQRRMATEALQLAEEQRIAFAGIYSGDYRRAIDDAIEKSNQAIEARRLELHTNAAAKLAVTDYNKAVHILSTALGTTTNQAKEYIDAQLLLNNLTEEGINKLYGLAEAADEVKRTYQDLIASTIQANQQQEQSSYMNMLLAQNMQIVFEQLANNNQAMYQLGYTAEETLLPLSLLTKNADEIARAMGVSTEQVISLITSFHNLQSIDFAKIRREITGIYIPGTEGLGKLGQADREMFRAYSGLANVPAAISENVDKELKKRNGVVKDNNDRMLQMAAEANEKIIEYDKEMYRKRIRDLQEFYADMVTTLQRSQYEMTANDLDLVEGRNSKLEDKDRQRLLARENIEAYSRLQLIEATRKANDLAVNGQASFAKEYLGIEKDRIKDTEQLNWKLHDTKVRLEGDPEAQQRAQQIYDQALGELNTYYDTRVGLAQAAANQEGEEERAARKQMIQDAIDGVMALTDVDETKRKSIVEGLEIAKTAITDLSGTYVDKVDAMRGSLILLAQALANVKENASILTPEQLNMFNSIGGVNVGGGGGGDVTVTTTTVNVGGISISVTTQADPNEIARIVLDTLQRQQNQRAP